MKNAIVILLAGMACTMLIVAGCTSTSGTTPAMSSITPAATDASTTATIEPTLTATMTTSAPAETTIPAVNTTTTTVVTIPSWDGTWNTSYSSKEYSEVVEILTLTQNGLSVAGSYGHGNGTIAATVQDNKVVGTWNETDETGAYSGFFVFEKSADDKSFDGKWVYTSEGTDALKNTTQYWNGVRV